MSTEDDIRRECKALAEFLLEKNRNYGDSALEPVRIFSKADTAEQLRVRIDDKLSRLKRGSKAGEDVLLDLLGYFLLLKVHESRQAPEPPQWVPLDPNRIQPNLNQECLVAVYRHNGVWKTPTPFGNTVRILSPGFLQPPKGSQGVVVGELISNTVGVCCVRISGHSYLIDYTQIRVRE